MDVRQEKQRDHGGGLDAAIGTFGGARPDWIDLSTGINQVPYPLPALPQSCWTELPDRVALERLETAARAFWQVPDWAEVVVAGGTSALIAALPRALAGAAVDIPAPTYNEHAAAFAAAGWQIGTGSEVRVLVHPNNPDGRLWTAADLGTGNAVIDESFCDVLPAASLMPALTPQRVILKGIGKFWGLAGLRLGFAICAPEMAARLRTLLGPWPASGPALAIGAAALSDTDWAEETRRRLAQDAARLDTLLRRAGARPVGGTSLFRLVETADAARWQRHLAERHIWTRIFPYSRTWVRFGLPAPQDWTRIEAALEDLG